MTISDEKRYELFELAMTKYRCRECQVTADGRVWIHDPQEPRWLSEIEVSEEVTYGR